MAQNVKLSFDLKKKKRKKMKTDLFYCFDCVWYFGNVIGVNPHKWFVTTHSEKYYEKNKIKTVYHVCLYTLEQTYVGDKHFQKRILFGLKIWIS